MKEKKMDSISSEEIGLSDLAYIRDREVFDLLNETKEIKEELQPIKSNLKNIISEIEPIKNEIGPLKDRTNLIHSETSKIQDVKEAISRIQNTGINTNHNKGSQRTIMILSMLSIALISYISYKWYAFDWNNITISEVTALIDKSKAELDSSIKNNAQSLDTSIHNAIEKSNEEILQNLASAPPQTNHLQTRSIYLLHTDLMIITIHSLVKA